MSDLDELAAAAQSTSRYRRPIRNVPVKKPPVIWIVIGSIAAAGLLLSGLRRAAEPTLMRDSAPRSVSPPPRSIFSDVSRDEIESDNEAAREARQKRDSLNLPSDDTPIAVGEAKGKTEYVRGHYSRGKWVEGYWRHPSH